jgi:hypothetical protein
MKKRRCFLIELTALLFCLLIFASQAEAMSFRQITANDPEAPKIIATRKYSPFEVMGWTSFFSSLTMTLAFIPVENTPDYQRENVQAIGGVAVYSYFAAGIFSYFANAYPISHDVEEKIGSITKTQADSERMASKRRAFYFVHGFDMIPAVLYASQSNRQERWAWASAVAIAPVLSDLVARHVFDSDAVSPWTLSATVMEEPRGFTPGLVASFSFQ